MSIPTSEYMTLGGIEVEAKPLTPLLYRKVILSLDTLPNVALKLTETKGTTDVLTWLYRAHDVAYDEFMDIVALASGIDREHIETKAGMTTEVIPFMIRVFEVNRMSDDDAKKVWAALRKYLPTSNA